MPSRQEHPRAEERDLQRAVLPRALPAPAGDAGRHDHRGAGAGGRHPRASSPPTSSRHNTRFYFVGIDKARFRKPVVPGDQLVLRRTVERALKGIWKFATAATSGEHEVAHAEMMVAPESRRVIDPRAVVSPQAQLAADVTVGPFTHHRAGRGDRRGHGRSARTRSINGPTTHRRRQPDLPVRLHRRCAAGQEVPGRADAPRDRRPQRVPRELHRQPRHHPR